MSDVREDEPNQIDALVARLRLGGPNALEVCDEAADEIARLTARLKGADTSCH